MTTKTNYIHGTIDELRQDIEGFDIMLGTLETIKNISRDDYTSIRHEIQYLRNTLERKLKDAEETALSKLSYLAQETP